MKRLIFLFAMTISSCATDKALHNPEQLSKIGRCPGSPDPSIRQGKVVMLVDVDRQGKAYNIRILESDPKGLWDESAICLTKLKTFKKNDKGEPAPFQNFREELRLKILE